MRIKKKQYDASEEESLLKAEYRCIITDERNIVMGGLLESKRVGLVFVLDTKTSQLINTLRPTGNLQEPFYISRITLQMDEKYIYALTEFSPWKKRLRCTIWDRREHFKCVFSQYVADEYKGRGSLASHLIANIPHHHQGILYVKEHRILKNTPNKTRLKVWDVEKGENFIFMPTASKKSDGFTFTKDKSGWEVMPN